MSQPVSKHAVEAELLLKTARSKKRPAYMHAEYVHTACNQYLTALRSGSRRRRYSLLRYRLRELRANVASELRPIGVRRL